MKNFVIAAVMLLGGVALAQPSSNGKVKIHGTVGSVFLITGVDEAPLDAEVDFTDLLNGATTVTTQDVDFRMRSNINYQVTASMTAPIPSPDITPDKISYTFATPTHDGRTRVHDVGTNDRTGDIVAGNETGTIDALTGAGLPIYAGDRICGSGSFTDAQNYLLANASFTMANELYPAGAVFEYLVTLTMASP